MGWLADLFHDMCCYFNANSTMENGGDARVDILESTGMEDVKKVIEKDVLS